MIKVKCQSKIELDWMRKEVNRFGIFRAGIKAGYAATKNFK